MTDTITITPTTYDTNINASTYTVTIGVSVQAIQNFLDLLDTPSSYSGKGEYFLKVKSSEDGIEFVVAAAGSGDVTGPGSSTDNAIARYDGVTGKIIQDSVVTINDITGIMKGVSEVWFDNTGDYKIVLNGTSLEIWVQGVMVQDWG